MIYRQSSLLPSDGNALFNFTPLLPEFRSYKIVVLDDEILVIDPATREIVDVIPA